MEDDRALIVVVTWTFLILSLAFLILRLWIKTSRGNGLWWDDHVLWISWSLNYATGIINTLQTTIGLGQHIAVVNPVYLGDLTLLGNVAGTFSILAAQLSKTSFAITLLRIATQTWLRAVVWLALITINVAMTVNNLSQWVQCNPSQKYWIPTTPGTCWPPGVQSTVSVVSAAYSGVMDVLLALLPWQIVMGLQMRPSDKFGVAAAMSLGIFAGAAAGVKAYFIPGLSAGDFTFLSSTLIVWSDVEVGLSIIAACIPTLRVLIRDKINSRNATAGTTKRVLTTKNTTQDSTTRSMTSANRTEKGATVNRDSVNYIGFVGTIISSPASSSK